MTTLGEFANLTDADLKDIGMYRCVCGAAVYPNGVLAPHCDKDAEHTSA